jgi:hypothetical protein
VLLPQEPALHTARSELQLRHALVTRFLRVRLCSVIATKAAVPLVYVPLEGVSSKWCAPASSLLQQVSSGTDSSDGIGCKLPSSSN